MEKLCPITGKIVNENVARMNSILVILLFGLYFLTNSSLIIIFLLIDFAIRGYFDGKMSILTMLSTKLLSAMNVAQKRINAGPKIFAAQVGGGLTTLVIICHFMDWNTYGCVFAITLMFFAFLEAAFGFCVACKLYPLIRRKE